VPSHGSNLRSCLKHACRTAAVAAPPPLSALSQECAPISPTHHVVPLSPPAGLARRRVGWGTATFHHHPPILGDGVCSSGPPLSIGWRPYESVTVRVDEYDDSVSQHSGLRRAPSQLVLPSLAREQILRDAGFSRATVARAAEQAVKDRVRRARSAHDGRIRRAIGKTSKALTDPFMPWRHTPYDSDR
jgi:hypothetical protein